MSIAIATVQTVPALCIPVGVIWPTKRSKIIRLAWALS